jgi:uncharacterized protein YaaR (DUF327 family)
VLYKLARITNHSNKGTSSVGPEVTKDAPDAPIVEKLQLPPSEAVKTSTPPPQVVPEPQTKIQEIPPVTAKKSEDNKKPPSQDNKMTTEVPEVLPPSSASENANSIPPTVEQKVIGVLTQKPDEELSDKNLEQAKEAIDLIKQIPKLDFFLPKLFLFTKQYNGLSLQEKKTIKQNELYKDAVKEFEGLLVNKSPLVMQFKNSVGKPIGKALEKIGI